MMHESVRALCAHGEFSIYQCQEPWCVEAVKRGGYCDYVSFQGTRDEFRAQLIKAIEPFLETYASPEQIADAVMALK
jgi:hypothetical protein